MRRLDKYTNVLEISSRFLEKNEEEEGGFTWYIQLYMKVLYIYAYCIYIYMSDCIRYMLHLKTVVIQSLVCKDGQKGKPIHIVT